jgi:predicted dehydrogenase
MATNDSVSRRDVLKVGSAIAAATIVPRHVLGGPKHIAPSDRVNVALVGSGGRGLQNARELLKLNDVRISVVADPAEKWDLSNYYYRGVAGRLPTCDLIEKHYADNEPKFKCQQFEDYRKMLDVASSDVDAVLCATPDHLHALVSLAAMRAGKHVYCEKPLTHNIAEARLVAKVARESGVATQLGNQGHSKDTIRLTCELIRSGAIGDVHDVHAWVRTTRWNPTLQKPPSDARPVPKGLNWDLWCGPRKPPGFHEAYAPVSWRDFWQFGCGAMGDFGCHDLDSSVWALELDLPERIEMTPAGSSDPGMAPYGEIGYFDFAGKAGKPPVRISWYSGGLKPATPSELPDNVALPSRGVLFEGSKGVMVCGGAGGQPDIYPLELRQSIETPEPTIPRSAGHHRDWIDAIKGGPAASSEFQYGAKLTEITLLGLVAMRTGKVIHWDAPAMKAKGVAQADSIIHGEYRDGWGLNV